MSRVGLQVSKAVKAVLAHMKREAASAPTGGAIAGSVPHVLLCVHLKRIPGRAKGKPVRLYVHVACV